ncbi:MAG: hypothetical protein CMK60_10245 [Proteobacteria bacterium]|nr:hypothetical protein [Pseudomonadota bacterium]MBP09764.1 hypothetical protein [Acidiferrobacteraceae bacterium]MDP7221238.1 pilus assembly protein PilP [Arenicellales bacterium]HCF74274.1 hypothetical protein [Gammaproteobacteria bacterium]HJP11727.1 pilus assembly protein PilP [Arenicellales bacterium]
MAVGISLVASCSSDRSMVDLQNYVHNTHKDTIPKVESLPELLPIKAFEYTASAMTDPFAPENVFPEIVEEEVVDPGPDPLAPDPERRREALERFPLDTLRFAGTLTLAEVIRLVVVAPDGLVYKVPEGGYLGQDHGRVIRINSKTGAVELEEVVMGNFGRWELRTVNLNVRQ